MLDMFFVNQRKANKQKIYGRNKLQDHRSTMQRLSLAPEKFTIF